MERTFICDTKSDSCDFYPTSDGVLVEEENFEIYHYNLIGEKTFFCKVPNKTWKGNSTGVYFKEPNRDKIFHVRNAGEKAYVLCETKEFFWAPHNKGGIFVYEQKNRSLRFHSEILTRKYLFGIVQFNEPIEHDFTNNGFVYSNAPGHFFPFDSGFVALRDNIITHYKNHMPNESLCIEPIHGKWNAHGGNLVISNGDKILAIKGTKAISICEEPFSDFKGSEKGVFVRFDFKHLYYFQTTK